MIDWIEWLRVFIFHYASLEYLIIFLGVSFAGEVAILPLGFLAAQGTVSIFALLIFGLMGTLFSDVLWFFLAKTTIVKKMISHHYANKTISVVHQAINRISKGNYLATLILAKFVVGTRILLIMYISTTDIGFKRFVRYNVIAIFLWLVIVASIGFISGLGFTYFAEILENMYAAIGFVLLVVILITILHIWLKKRFTDENQNMI